MITPDLINSVLVLVAGGFILISVKKLYKDKIVKGVSWAHVGFFSLYGFWHIYFFSSLEQWWSVAGGSLTTFTNTIWLLQLIYYTVYPGGRNDQQRTTGF